MIITRIIIARIMIMARFECDNDVKNGLDYYLHLLKKSLVLAYKKVCFAMK